jgi:hypothetical protein
MLMSKPLDFASPLIWTNPRAAKDRPTLVRLTADSLTLAKIPSGDLEDVVAGLKRGEEAAGELIPLSAVSGASGDDDGAELAVTYKSGKSGTESRTIAFADKEKRGEFLLALAGALGPPWRQIRKPVSRWTAGFWTLGPTAAVAVVTWLLSLEAAQIAQGKPPANWGKGRLRLAALIAHWLEQQLGPTGILIAGGILVGIGLLIFAAVMASPPMKVVIERGEEG